MADALVLEDYPDAEGWVVWAVDMDGRRHNMGVLDGNLVLEEAVADFVVARIFLTAEPALESAAPDGERLFVATLRSVEEVEATEVEEELRRLVAEWEDLLGAG